MGEVELIEPTSATDGAPGPAEDPAPSGVAIPRIPRRVEIRISADGSLVVVPDLPAELAADLERIGSVSERACLLPERPGQA